MVQYLMNRWIQLILVAAVMAVAGAVVTQVAFSGGEEEGGGVSVITAGDRVLVTSPLQAGKYGGTGYGETGGAVRNVVMDELPLTAAAAVAAGWKDPFLCDVGRGRTFQKVGEQDVPYFLLYNINDELQGIYLFSRSEIPLAPWVKRSNLVAGGRPVIEEEHWAMVVNFKDPIRACGAKEGGCGFNPYC